MGGYWNLGGRDKLSERSLYFTHAIQKFYLVQASLIFFMLTGNLLLREGQFHTAKFLKSVDFKLYFAYTLVLLKVTFWHICTELLF